VQPVQAFKYAAAAERPHEASEPLQVRAFNKSEQERWPSPSQQVPTHTLW
jgi:hypothetical protein